MTMTTEACAVEGIVVMRSFWKTGRFRNKSEMATIRRRGRIIPMIPDIFAHLYI
jgi:hypothetical protein